jgi:hypothetical protein
MRPEAAPKGAFGLPKESSFIGSKGKFGSLPLDKEKIMMPYRESGAT